MASEIKNAKTDGGTKSERPAILAAANDDEIWLRMRDAKMLDKWPVLYFDSIGSTSTEAKKQAEKGADSGLIVVACGQEEGRGRLGRIFLSPAGTGLYFSQLHAPNLPPDEIPRMTLAAGLAVACVIKEMAKVEPGIKWPNDILIGGRKVGGILAESIAINGQIRVILGIGINVTTTRAAFPGELAAKASSIFLETGLKISRGSLLLAIVKELEKIFNLLRQEGGFSVILEEWKSYDVTVGRTLQWVTPGGGLVEGVSLGPDNSGQLRVRDRHGHEHLVMSGDINLAEGKE